MRTPSRSTMPLPPSFPQVLFACGAAQRDALPAGWALCNGSNGTRICGAGFCVRWRSHAVGRYRRRSRAKTLKQFNHTGGSWVEDLCLWGEDGSTHDNHPPTMPCVISLKL